LHNRKNGESIVNAWVTQLSKSDHEHRLTLLYVANDVVQNCRKKAPEMKGKNVVNFFYVYNFLKKIFFINFYVFYLFLRRLAKGDETSI
jgi:hypothetical protein